MLFSFIARLATTYCWACAVQETSQKVLGRRKLINLETRAKSTGGGGTDGGGGDFPYKAYEQVQISSSSTGSALERAVAVWLTPLNLKLDESNKIIPVETLKGVSDPAMKNIFKMSREAEDAEKNFNSAIAKAGSEDKTLLKNGKKANKVFKLMGECLYGSIQLAKGQGQDREAFIAKETKKLTKNINNGGKTPGVKMKSFLSGSGSTSSSGST